MRFDSKTFNPQAFGAYVKRIPNVKKNELAKSGAVGSNEQARAALSSQTGSLYARIPFFGRISGSTSQNNNGNADIVSSTTSTFDQGFVTASRMDGWTEKSFSKNITAGVDFMDNVAAQIADYKQEVKQAILLSILKGVFSMKTTGSTVSDKANKNFIDKHTFDISGNPDNNVVAADTLNKAIQKACGDNKAIFKLVVMHSEVATNLENLKLLKYLTYTDADGITRDLAIGTWNGRTVLIDDEMPTAEVAAVYTLTSDAALDATKTYYTRSGSANNYTYTAVASPDVTDIATYYEMTAEAYTTYTTYVLGEGAIILDDIGDEVPYEMSRDAKTNGGQDTLYVRDRFICGVDGISFEKPASITESASNADLETGTNWVVINDGKEAIPDKAIAIAQIVSRG